MRNLRYYFIFWLKLSALIFLIIPSTANGQNVYELREVPSYGGAVSEINAINDSSIAVGEAQESNSKWSGFFIQGISNIKTIPNADALRFYYVDGTRFAYGVVDPNPFNYTAQLQALNGVIINYFINRGTYVNNSMFGGDKGGNFAVGNVRLVANGPRIPTRIGGGIFFGFNPVTFNTLGGSEGEMRSATSQGVFVGWSNVSSGAVHATIWVSGLTLDLAPSNSSSTAYNINDAGRIVGVVDNRAVYWADQNSTPTSMGSIGGTSSVALYQNDVGEAVGYEQFASGRHGFIWTASGGMVDVNNLLPRGSGWIVQEARGINNEGQIVGIGLNALGQQRGFILSPISKSVDVSNGFQLKSVSDGRAWITDATAVSLLDLNNLTRTPSLMYPVTASPGDAATAVAMSSYTANYVKSPHNPFAAPAVLWSGKNGSFWLSFGRATQSVTATNNYNYLDTYGWQPYNSSWKAVDVATDSNNITHVLLASVDKLAVIWSVDPQGNVLRTKVIPGTSGYAPSRMTAGKISTDPNLRLVWKSTDGSNSIQIMTLDTSTLATKATLNVASPSIGFTFQDIDIESTVTPYLLWTAPFGAEITSTVNLTTGAHSNVYQFGPYGAIDCVAISVEDAYFMVIAGRYTYLPRPTLIWNYWPEVGTNEGQVWFNTPTNTNSYGYYTYY